ncbi:MAG TPA: lysophospholipid acyltransferase family protein [Xanthobacteraceae bacterium]|nr:lysophospholipid acyltransferase family protein [Xanthobacteraceae bacterium]
MRLVIVIAAIALITIALLPFQWIAVKLALPMRRRIPTFYHRMICALLGVRVRVIGTRFDQKPLLIVSNHVSWLDISVLTSVAPVVFVAKQEVAGWPLFGLLAKLQRTVFVSRTQRQKTAEATAEMASRLAEGDPVVLFGEGTSSDGNRVLEFRSALVGAARDALAADTTLVWIQPLSIAYTGMLGLPLGRQHRPLVAWYGDFDLAPHFAEVIRRGGIDVTLTWGDPIPFDQDSDRKTVTKALETQIRRMTSLALRGRRGA